jgi:uncharacterized LabA/DUF88 family protein
MARTRRKRRQAAVSARRPGATTIRVGKAPPHGKLANPMVHVFVDDQNLFWGIVNDHYGPGFRIDFGKLLLAAARGTDGQARFVQTAYIAGVIPDDDSFWEIAKSRGFTVRRGFLGAGNRSKQDDAYLITDMTATLYEQQGPATVILVAGDADYVPPLQKTLERGWRTEVAFIDRGVSVSLEPVAHEIRVISPFDIEHERA